jgi:RHS repeat-associated protein
LPTRSYRDAVYDDRDRLRSYLAPDGTTTVSFAYDHAARLASRSDGTGTTTYRYDALGNLLEVVTPAHTIEYQVDGLGRRVSRRLDGAVTHVWVYRDRLDPVAELDAGGRLRRLFVYGTTSHSPDLIVDVDPLTGTTTAVHRVLLDHVGSPRALVNVVTGAVSSEARFDAFGRAVVGSPDATLGFAGGIHDPETGLIRFGARDYAPELGRWTAPDPSLWGGMQTNLYAYVHGDPVNAIDPTGQVEATTTLVVWGGINITVYGLTVALVALTGVVLLGVAAYYAYEHWFADDSVYMTAEGDDDDARDADAEEGEECSVSESERRARERGDRWRDDNTGEDAIQQHDEIT